MKEKIIATDEHPYRIGVQTAPYDPYWVQVQEAILEQALRSGVTLNSIELPDQSAALSNEEQDRVIQELIGQNLHAFICINLPASLIHRMLEAHLPAIYLDESPIRHPLFVSSYGLYEAARLMASYLKQKLSGPSRLLCIGGDANVEGDPACSRMTGVYEVLQDCPRLTVEYVPSPWLYEQACAHLTKALSSFRLPFDAIFGLSDSLALAGRDACQALGLTTSKTLFVGINADPFALAAIADGSLGATVDIHAGRYGQSALSLACQAARHEPLPEHITYENLSLVTQGNLNEAATQKLIDIAGLPGRLVGVRRDQEQARLAQLEISTAINHRVGALLDRQQLTREIAELIRANYGYDRVSFYSWTEADRRLERDDVAGKQPVELSALLAETVRRNQPILIPDTLHSSLYPPDPEHIETRTRVILPVRMGEKLIGILDLHRHQPTAHLQIELVGLQSLADQLGIALVNADLYAEAVSARAQAEKADQLKTRLLANVSHELRTPTNTILGYSQMMLKTPNPYQHELPESIQHDLQHIHRGGQQLTRLINDLLDLSRAEIGELNVFPEIIATRAFIEEVFHSAVDTFLTPMEVAWHLELPERLPVIQADPARLQQILSNLLHNASKYTASGTIELGARVTPSHLHLWVSDTGPGIDPEVQEHIFEPFGTARLSHPRQRGIGLGLSITRHLVALHGGQLTVESTAGQGSTFHISLPLPNLIGQTARAPQLDKPVLFVLSASEQGVHYFEELYRFLTWKVQPLNAQADLDRLWRENQPAGLAWDLDLETPEDWKLIERLQRHPGFNQLPFILYANVPGENAGLLSVLAKPVKAKSLVETLNALKPATAAGPIVIVDDDGDARAYYHRLIAEAFPGSPIRLAENGMEALAILAEAEVPSLVLLDLIMPKVDGFTVLERMRANHRTRQVPIVVVSGHTLTPEDVQRLDYARVTFHSKGLLSPEEAIANLRQALSDQIALPQPTSALVKRVLAYFHQNYQHNLSRQQVAAVVGVNEDYLSRIFRREMGITPWECLNRHRVQKARELLAHTSASITEIAVQVGFDDSAYFSRVFRQYTGVSPKAFRSR